MPTKSEATGQKPTEVPRGAVEEVITEAYLNGIYVSSNYARYHAVALAAAASKGFLTTDTGQGFGRIWRPTLSGMAYVQAGIDTE